MGTADCVLHGLGLMVGVAKRTAHRHEMSSFKVWLRKDRPNGIPKCRWLYIEEPRRRRSGVWARAARTSSVWYNIRISKLTGPIVDEELCPPPVNALR